MPSIILSDNGASSGSAGLKSTAASDGALALQTTTAGGTATTAVSIDTSQNVTMAGRTTNPTTISVGGATPSTSGAGISFPATQSASTDANTLDDYEEGTFTPIPRFGGNNVGMVYTSAGKYTKVGNLVTVQVYVAITNKGSSTGGYSIYGLPFAPVGYGGFGPYYSTSIYVQGGQITGLSGNWIQPNVNGSSVAIDMNYANQNTGSDGNTSNGSVGTTGSVWITATYLTS